MTARAIWKGKLKLNSITLPVKLYSAVQDQTVHFHILEGQTKARVRQHMIDPVTGKEIPAEDIQKAFEIEPGKFVLLTRDELESVEPKVSREIEITHFLPAAEIAPEFYD